MIDRMITHGFHLTKLAQSHIRWLPDWEILSSLEGSLAVVAFRFSPCRNNTASSECDFDDVNSLISKHAATRNLAVIFTTRLKGRVSMRICTINPQTTEDILYVIRGLDCIAREVWQNCSDGGDQ